MIFFFYKKLQMIHDAILEICKVVWDTLIYSLNQFNTKAGVEILCSSIASGMGLRDSVETFSAFRTISVVKWVM